MAKTVVQHLRTELANAWVFYANLKHYHWQTFGPLFRDTHLLFEEFATAVHGTIDELAERIRMLDQDVDLVTLRDYQEAAEVKSSKLSQSVKVMLMEAHASALTVLSGMIAAVAAADKENDPGSVDLFSKTVQIYEKFAWFLSQMLKGKDGLVG
jgi:starvation-inducible DNA-binding protein